MKKIKVVTVQRINQTWEYEVEVDDDFVINNQALTFQQKAMLLDKIYNDGIEGHCWDDDNIVSEEVTDFDWIKA